MVEDSSKKEMMRIYFRNAAGLLNKDNETWEYLSKFTFLGITETWIEEGKWKKIKRGLPKQMNWKCRYVIRENKKGRAKGGIIAGIREGTEELDYEDWHNNIMERKVMCNGNKWRIITVYSQEIKQTMKVIKERVEEREEEYLLLGGNWNPRIGSEEGMITKEQEDSSSIRKSKDQVINGEGRILINELESGG